MAAILAVVKNGAQRLAHSELLSQRVFQIRVQLLGLLPLLKLSQRLVDPFVHGWLFFTVSTVESVAV